MPKKLKPNIDILRLEKRKTIFTQTFVESINEELLDDLIESNLLEIDLKERYQCSERTYLKSLRKELNNGVLSVKYNKPKCGYGRVQPKRFSLSIIRKAVRHTLCEGQDYVDIDIKNCHPTILYQLCKKADIPCLVLEQYVKNRENMLEQVGSILNMCKEEAREEAKILFIRLMYMGSVRKWKEEMNIDKVPEFCNEFRNEMKYISSYFEQANPDMSKEIKAFKEKNKAVKTDCFLSYYLQEKERRVLETIYKRLEEKVENDCVLCYDGIMIKKKDHDIETIMTECQDAILNELGLDLKLEVKPLSNSLKDQLEDAEPYKYTVPEAYKDTISTKYLSTLDYPEQKRYTDRFVVKVLFPQPIWIICQKYEDDGFQTNRYTDSNFRSTYMNVPGFAKKYMKDTNIRVYNREVFEPYNGVFNPMQDNLQNYNLFKGYSLAIQKQILNPQDKIMKIFLDILLNLCEGNERVRNFFLINLAFKVQFPNIKIPFCFIFTGPQGIGKNVIMAAIGRIFGFTHYYETHKPADLFGNHAEGFLNKLLVVLNECEGRDTINYESCLKQAVTDIKLTLNQKNLRPIVIKNYAMMVILTNKSNPIPMDVVTRERRYVVVKGTSKYLESKYSSRFWSKLVKRLQSDEFTKHLYDYLCKMDVSNIDWREEREACLTESYRNMVKLNVPYEMSYFFEMYNKTIAKEASEFDDYLPRIVKNGIQNSDITQYDETVRVLESDLYKNLYEYLKEHDSIKERPKKKKFINRIISQLSLPIRSAKKYNGYETLEFNIHDIYQHAVEANWVEGDKEIDTTDYTDEIDKMFE